MAAARAPAPVVVLLRRLQPRPGGPGAGGAPADGGDVLGRCEGGALAAALDLGAGLDAPVAALAVGPARREERVLAMALRAGCTRAIRVDDGEVGDVDYLGLAQVIAAAVRAIDARIVVCGDRSADEATGAIGPAVAELLGWPHLTGVGRLAADGDALVAVRRADDAWQRFRIRPPAVICVEAPPIAGAAVTAVPAPRDDDEPDRRKRARTPVPTIEELDLGDLALDARAIAPRRSSAGKLRAVRARGATTLATGADDLVARLRADRLLVDAPAGDGERAAGGRAPRGSR